MQSFTHDYFKIVAEDIKALSATLYFINKWFSKEKTVFYDKIHNEISKNLLSKLNDSKIDGDVIHSY